MQYSTSFSRNCSILPHFSQYISQKRPFVFSFQYKSHFLLCKTDNRPMIFTAL